MKFEKPGPKEKKKKGKPLPPVREVPNVKGMPCVVCGETETTVWCHMSSDEKFYFDGGGMGDKIDDRVGAILCVKHHKEMDTPPTSKADAIIHAALWYRYVTLSWLYIWDNRYSSSFVGE